MRTPIRFLTLLTLLLGLAGGARAVPLTVPPDLNPGDQYRLLFVTSTTTFATSADIADYNAFVTAVANTIPELSALGTTWTAIASTSTVDARDNTGTNPSVSTGVPIYSTNPARNCCLFFDYADMWDALGANSAVGVGDEDGNAFGRPFPVWTGTDPDGTAASALGTASPTFGSAGKIKVKGDSNEWITAGTDDAGTWSYNLYALSGVLTVVPEPGTILLVLLGLGGYAASGRRFP